ncbi:MAG: cytochrome c biogenesis protein CcsA [Chloroflexi bacterium]|nr:cytochrome c biogenesis protein CcsA [Chloroflexota bacterium]
MSVVGRAAAPQRFPSIRLRPLDLLGLVAFVLIAVSMGMALLYAPTELIQGDPQRVFYVHLPMAIVSYIAFAIVFVSSILYLWKRRIVYDVVARSSAEIGVFFTTLVIISGGLWGQATWGTFWQWEPRLTFTFILWLIYVAYLMLRQAAQDKERVARFAAVLAIIGFADVPLVFASVYLWRGIHPEPAGMPQAMATTLFVSIAAFLALFSYLLIHRIRVDRAREELDEMLAMVED